MRFFSGATERPVGYSQLNRANPLAGGCTYLSNCDSHYPFDVVNKSLGIPAGAITTSVGSLGQAIDTFSASVSNQITIASPVDKIVPLDRCTVIVVRQKKDSTIRTAANWGASSSFRGAAPSTGGTLFWEFGTANATVSGLTWDTRLDYLVYIAGPNKGREVWRNGQRILSSADFTARAADGSNPFLLGRSGGLGSDIEYIYMFGVFDHEWSDVDCLAWFKNPWQLFKGPSTLYFTQRIGAITSSGALIGQGSSISGNASAFSLITTTGVLTGQGSIVSGSSTLTKSHSAIGTLISSQSVINGSSNVVTNHQAAGALISSGALVTGTSLSFTLHDSSGQINGSSSLLSGASYRSSDTDYHDYILIESQSNNIIAETQNNTIILESSN